jgi:hypothetical protein
MQTGFAFRVVNLVTTHFFEIINKVDNPCDIAKRFVNLVTLLLF